jgi:3-keto-5-aminohexanoate cleavage enzyme
MARKLIVTVAATGAFQGKAANPALPEQPDEIAAEARRCRDAGAAIIHVHARDRNGAPTSDVTVFREINGSIRALSDIIIQNTTSPVPVSGIDVDEGLTSLDAGPEMCSLDIGAIITSYGENEARNMWTRDWCRKAAKMMMDRGIKPEFELFGPHSLEDLKNYIIPDGLALPPYCCTFVMGMKISQGAMEFTPENLMFMRSMLPKDAFFTVMGVGRHQLEATMLSMLLGGNVRVGLEDNIYYRKGELATNVRLVERVVSLAGELGFEVATPSEARIMLGIPQLPVG